MSASKKRLLRGQTKTGVAALLWLLAQTGMAQGIPDLLGDPLLTRPSILETGAVLPGDAAPIACATSWTIAQPLTLAQAVDTGLCHSPQISVAWAAIREQAAAVGQARSAYLPTVTASVTQQRERLTYPGQPAADTIFNGRSTYASMNWRLWDFGEREANRHAANDLLAAAMDSYDAALQKTLVEIVQAYFDGQVALAAQEARSLDRQWAEQTLAAARRREAHGVAGRNDTLQAIAALAKAQLAEGRARGDARKALATLAYAMGVPADTVITLAPDTTPPVKEDIAELDQWLAFAQARHPAIQAARRQVQAAEEKIASARAEGLPTASLGVNWYQNGYPDQGLQQIRSNTAIVGITLSIPLFEGFARTYKIRESQAVAERSKAQLYDTERQVTVEIIKAHADAQAAVTNLAASIALLQAAEDALSSSNNRYEHGVADIQELLTAQSALSDARQEEIRSEAEWRSARLRLFADTGLLGRDSLITGVSPKIGERPEALPLGR